jgi:hypothetical protein
LAPCRKLAIKAKQIDYTNEGNFMRAALAALLLAFSIGSSHAACTAENAVYKHIVDETFSMSLSKQNNPKAWSNIQTTLQTPSRRLDFEFTTSNGYEMQYLVLLTKGVDQKRDIVVSFLDTNLKSQMLPQAGEPAPEYIFTPDLGLWLYYSKLEPQDYIPPGMWKFSSCNK